MDGVALIGVLYFCESQVSCAVSVLCCIVFSTAKDKAASWR